MPIIHTINPAEKLVITLWLGNIGPDEAVAAYVDLYSRDDWQPGFSELADLRKADMSAITSAALQAISDLFDTKLAEAGVAMKTAVVAPQEREFGVSSIYEAIAEETPEEFRVFRDFEDAVAWLS